MTMTKNRMRSIKGMPKWLIFKVNKQHVDSRLREETAPGSVLVCHTNNLLLIRQYPTLEPTNQLPLF
jgi:hypothetical protein